MTKLKFREVETCSVLMGENEKFHGKGHEHREG